MKQPPYFIYLLFLLLCFSSCRKDEEIKLYPKTYKLTGYGVDYKVWIKDEEKSASITPSYFYGSIPFITPDFPITLLNDHQLTGYQVHDTTPYFFRNDSLFISALPSITHGMFPPPPRTTVFLCPGNYSFLVRTISHMARGKWKGDILLLPIEYQLEFMTKEKYFEFFLPGTGPDTLAIYNYQSFFK